MTSLLFQLFVFLALFGAEAYGMSVLKQSLEVPENESISNVSSGNTLRWSVSPGDDLSAGNDIEFLDDMAGGTGNFIDSFGAEVKPIPDSSNLKGRRPQNSPLERVIDGEIEPLRWLSDRKGRAFGDLPDVSQALSELRRTARGRPSAGRSLIRTNGLSCSEVTTLSPSGDSLAAIFPPNGASYCHAVVLPSEGSTLSIECPFFSMSHCTDEYLYLTDGAESNYLYCDGRRVEGLRGLKQLYVLFERRQQLSSSVSAFCTITAHEAETPLQISDDHYQICPNSCGKAPANTGVVRIIGGSQAWEGEYPWMVKLTIKMKNGEAFQCGGSILNSRNLLTAAHCVHDKENIEFIGVTIGRTGATFHAGEQLMLVSDWRAHHEYEGKTGQHEADIAILRLPKDLVLGELATPICLAHPANYENQLAVVTGWGATSNENPKISGNLMEAGVTVTNHAECSATYASSGNLLTERQICASEAGRDSCQGDSGGPLVTRLSSRWHQLGVVSFGIRCADPVFPGVYSFVPAYHDWIKENIIEGNC